MLTIHIYIGCSEFVIMNYLRVIPNFHPISANPGYGPPDPPEPPDPPGEPRYQGLRRSRKRYSPKSCSPGVEAVEAPICSMVLVYLPTKLGDFGGKYG